MPSEIQETNQPVKFIRAWCMPNHSTFKMEPVMNLLNEEMGLDWVDHIVDPFPFPYKEDAAEFLSKIPPNTKTSLVFDPPYSLRQLKEMYNNKGRALTQQDCQNYWSRIKDQIAIIIKKGGKVVCFGWNSNGMSKSRGFQLKTILLLCHGADHNDTIVTVEEKISF